MFLSHKVYIEVKVYHFFSLITLRSRCTMFYSIYLEVQVDYVSLVQVRQSLQDLYQEPDNVGFSEGFLNDTLCEQLASRTAVNTGINVRIKAVNTGISLRIKAVNTGIGIRIKAVNTGINIRLSCKYSLRSCKCCKQIKTLKAVKARTHSCAYQGCCIQGISGKPYVGIHYNLDAYIYSVIFETQVQVLESSVSLI